MMLIKIKNILRPIYYRMSLDKNRFFYIKKLGFNVVKKIKIGDIDILLDRSLRHENSYYLNYAKNEPCMDELLMIKLLRPNDIVLDAGANIGYLAAKFLEHGAGDIYCFEPVASVFNKLEKVKNESIHIFHAALSDRDGRSDIFISTSHNQGSSLKAEFLQIFPYVFGDKKNIETITLVKLDTLLSGTRFDYIKVDIEGSEIDFLKGAAETLRTHTPRIFQIESYSGFFDEAHKLLKQYYKFSARVNVLHSGGIFISNLNEKSTSYTPTDNFIYFNDIDSCPIDCLKI
jgi:FkbM family methyltransferase